MSKESVKLFAGRVYRPLLFLRAVMDRWPPIFVDRITKKPLSRPLSQRGVVVQIADDLAAQRPKIVDVLAYGLGRQSGCSQMLDERPEADKQRFAGWQILFQSHPGTRPLM